jgi:hypothetical protein
MKKLNCLFLFALLRLASSHAAPPPDKDRIVEPLDLEMVKRHENFGYSDEEIEKNFNVPFVIPLDRTGLNRALLKAPPAPGIHPRVLFNPEDIADIKKRSETTECGKLVMGNIRKHINDQFVGEKAAQYRDYQELIKGQIDGKSSEMVRGTAFVLLYECFRCLLDNDAEGGKNAAAAVVSLARIADGSLDKNIGHAESSHSPEDAHDWRVVGQAATYEGMLGLMYDFTYNWMNDEQRDTVRKVIVKSTAGMTFIGSETLRALQTNASNWIPWSCRFLFLVTAIEGEDGYDAAAWQRSVDAMTGFIGGFFDTGEAYEGWGKNFMFFEHMMIMAKRGKDLLASTHLRSAFQNFFLHAMNPWGDGFTFIDSLGGSGIPIARNADVVMYHFLYPGDVAADFVYRNQIRGDYANLTEKDKINTRHPFLVTDPLCSVIYASDYDGKKTWEESLQAATKDKPLSLFSEDTCNLLTRSAWDKNAVWLQYLNRAIPGGHQYCDRSHFSVSGLGRFWGIYHFMRQVENHYLPDKRSVMLIDEEGPSVSPAKCVAYLDRPQATFIATDLRHPWEIAGSRVALPYNEFRLNPSEVPWMNLPIIDLPDWLHSRNPKADPDIRKQQPSPSRSPVKFAYRSAGLVRGTHSYVLILDDLQKDEEDHTYTWGMTLADDVGMSSAKFTGTNINPTADIILKETGAAPSEGKRFLLVRVFQAAQLDNQKPGEVITIEAPNEKMAAFTFPKLVIPSRAKSPLFKVLLIPFREGEELPETTWNNLQTDVTVKWKDQTDVISFGSGEDGRSRFMVRRGAEKLIVFN